MNNSFCFWEEDKFSGEYNADCGFYDIEIPEDNKCPKCGKDIEVAL